MSLHLRLFSTLGILLAAAILAPAADPAETLPPGAKARLGSTRMRDLNGRWGTAALSRDGKFLVSATPTGFYRVDVTTGLAAEKGTTPPTYSAGRFIYSADGKRAVVLSDKNRVIDTESGKLIAEFDRHLPFNSPGTSFSADGGRIAFGSLNQNTGSNGKVTAVVFDVVKKAQVVEVTVLQNQSSYASLAPDGQTLVTWGDHYEQPIPGKPAAPDAEQPNQIIQVWDVATGKELYRTKRSGYALPRIVFAPDSKTIAIGGSVAIVRLLDARTGTEKHSLFGRPDQGTLLAFSPDGSKLAGVCSDGAVQVWDPVSGSRLTQSDPPAFGSPVLPSDIVFTGNDRAVVWGVCGLTGVVWEGLSGKLISPTGGHTSGVSSVAFVKGDQELYSGSSDGTVRRWSAGGEDRGEIALRGTLFGRGNVLIVPGGGFALADRGNLPFVYDLPGGRLVFSGALGAVYGGRQLSSADGVIILSMAGIPYPPPKEPAKFTVATVWDTAAGKKRAELQLPPGEILTMAVSPDRGTIVIALRPEAKSASKEALITSWNLATGKRTAEFAITRPDFYGSTEIVPTADNITALVNLGGTKLFVIDYIAGKQLREIDTAIPSTSPPVFSPDGTVFAVGHSQFGQPGIARVYNWESGKPVHTFKGHAMPVTCVAFSGDGKTLATGSMDTTVLLWDLK